MRFDELRRILVSWATRQPLVQRVHVVGAHALGRGDGLLELVIELDPALDWHEDAAAVGRWETQLTSALPMPLQLQVHSAAELARVREALQVAHICIHERTGRCWRGRRTP